MTSSVQQAQVRFDHPVLEPQKGHPVRISILSIIKPALTALLPPAAVVLAAGDPASKKAVEDLQKALLAVKAKYKVSNDAIETLSAATLTLNPGAIEACTATILIFQELVEGTYTQESAEDIVRGCTTLLMNHLEGGNRLQKIDDLCTKVLEAASVTQRKEDEVNNPAYAVADASSKVFAYLKQARDAREASHRFVIEEMPLYHAQTRELIGYECDALLGFHRTPETCRVTCLNITDGIAASKEATLQSVVPDGKPFGSHGLFTAGGNNTLKAIDKGTAHMTALSGFVKGLAAGHMDNSVVAGKRLYEIDLKECMIPFNTMPANMKVKRRPTDDDLEKLLKEAADEPTRAGILARQQTERKSIQMARMIILGLPQCDKPFDKATLLFITHPSLLPLMRAHHASILEKGYNIQESALTAQLERLIQLQALAKTELVKPKIEATPRDFYFHIFGGKELYEHATKVKQFPPILVFNGIVGCAYRHYIKDLSRPESLPVRSKDKPAQDTESGRIAFENLKALE